MFLEPFQIVECPFLVLEVIVEHTVSAVLFLEEEIAVEAFAHLVEFLSLGKNFGMAAVVLPFFARHLHFADEQIGERDLHGAHLIAVAAKEGAFEYVPGEALFLEAVRLYQINGGMFFGVVVNWAYALAFSAADAVEGIAQFAVGQYLGNAIVVEENVNLYFLAFKFVQAHDFAFFNTHERTIDDLHVLWKEFFGLIEGTQVEDGFQFGKFVY